MAEQQDCQNSPLMVQIERVLPRINFYRFCQLLEQMHPELDGIGCYETPTKDPLRFAPAPDMGFPAAELKRIEHHPYLARPTTVRTTFLGLYGVDSVLPYALLDDITQRQEGYEALIDFLDIFNHRIITQYYRIWLKYHYPACFVTEGKDAISRCLLNLTGLGIKGTEKEVATPSSRFLALLGLVTQRTRTAGGIVGVIKVLIPDIDVTVQEFYPIWVNIDNPTQLGGKQPMQLGKNAILGRRFKESNQTIKVTLIAKNANVIEGLLPGGQSHTDIMMLLRLYLGYRVDAQLYLQIDKLFLPKTQLKAQRSRLGQTARLSEKQGNQQSEFITTSLGCYCGLAA